MTSLELSKRIIELAKRKGVGVPETETHHWDLRETTTFSSDELLEWLEILLPRQDLTLYRDCHNRYTVLSRFPDCLGDPATALGNLVVAVLEGIED